MKKITLERFVFLANVRHNNMYDYTKSVYINSRTKITITCPYHGDFIQKANNHLNGTKCPKCKVEAFVKRIRNTLDYFFEKAKLKHNNKYDYSKVIYVKNRIKIAIICPFHGEFLQTPDTHLRGSGCKKCGDELTAEKNTLSLEYFIEKSREIHHDKYCYKNSNYQKNKELITILCKEHGHFTQNAGNHLKGAGCPKCKVDNVGWTYSKWYKNSLISRNFESYKVYIIRCWDENESFYKIGRTYTSVSHRFSGVRAMPYNYEIVKVLEGEPHEIFKMEISMKIDNKENPYIPKIKFPGNLECFSKINELCST